MKQKCTDCKGTGKFQSFLKEYNCEKCNGTGELTILEKSQSVFNLDKIVPESKLYIAGLRINTEDEIKFYDTDLRISMTKEKTFQVGHHYETRGGWKAVCIWCEEHFFSLSNNYYFVHQPNTHKQSFPVRHFSDGKVVTADSTPVYNQHPADIIGEWRE